MSFAGNSWGIDRERNSCLGCGTQEQFQNCADISIGYEPPPTEKHIDVISGNLMTMPLTITRQVEPTASVVASTTGIQTHPTKPTYVDPSLTGDASSLQRNLQKLLQRQTFSLTNQPIAQKSNRIFRPGLPNSHLPMQTVSLMNLPSTNQRKSGRGAHKKGYQAIRSGVVVSHPSARSSKTESKIKTSSPQRRFAWKNTEVHMTRNVDAEKFLTSNNQVKVAEWKPSGNINTQTNNRKEYPLDVVVNKFERPLSTSSINEIHSQQNSTSRRKTLMPMPVSKSTVLSITPTTPHPIYMSTSHMLIHPYATQLESRTRSHRRTSKTNIAKASTAKPRRLSRRERRKLAKLARKEKRKAKKLAREAKRQHKRVRSGRRKSRSRRISRRRRPKTGRNLISTQPATGTIVRTSPNPSQNRGIHRQGQHAIMPKTALPKTKRKKSYQQIVANLKQVIARAERKNASPKVLQKLRSVYSAVASGNPRLAMQINKCSKNPSSCMQHRSGP